MLLAALGLSLVHHHEDGLEHQDCLVCHFTQALRTLAVLAVVFFVGVVFAHFLSADRISFVSTSLPSSLLARAPPVFS